VIPTAVKRSLFQELFDQVPATYETLILAIKTQQAAWNAGTRSGEISATSGNGHSVQLSTSARSITPQDLAAFGGELRDSYEASNAALIAAGVAAPTDAQRYAEMLDRMQPITSLRGDYSGLRYAGSGVLR
jgi:hypothetical protein